jgi:hypothetical protein
MITTTLHQDITANYRTKSLSPSLLTRFFQWCAAQQEQRLLWLGVALVAHGCIITPLTVGVVMFTGNFLPLFVLAIASMGMALVTNLAALPTKITIPIFILSILIDVAIIITCIILQA